MHGLRFLALWDLLREIRSHLSDIVPVVSDLVLKCIPSLQNCNIVLSSNIYRGGIKLPWSLVPHRCP
jgi:hypothetical protein